MWLFIWPNLRPLHSRMLCAKLGWDIGQVDRCTCLPSIQICFSLHGKDVTIHLKKLSSSYPRILSAKFGWYWPGGLEKILKCGQHWWIQEFQNQGHSLGAVEFLGSEVFFDASFKHTLCSVVRVENKVHIVNIVWWLQLDWLWFYVCLTFFREDYIYLYMRVI